jgi:hypothetical protein
MAGTSRSVYECGPGWPSAEGGDVLGGTVVTVLGCDDESPTR